MDKLSRKGLVRNRYAKSQPLVSRNNEFQALNFVPHRSINRKNGLFDKIGCSGLGVDSYPQQLQNNSGNLVPSVMNKFKEEKPNASIYFGNNKQQIFSQPTRKQKKNKHRYKDKQFAITLIDSLNVKLLNILKYMLYVMWCPIFFFGRLVVTLTVLPLFILYYVWKVLILRAVNMSHKSAIAMKSLENVPISSNKSSENYAEKKPTLGLSDFTPEQSSDAYSNNCLVSKELKLSNRVDQTQIEDKRSLKELMSLQKKLNLSFQELDKSEIGNRINGTSLQLQGESYPRYSSCYQDISSVELSSDYTSNKHSSRFYSIKDSFSTSKNCSFKGSKTIVDNKRRMNSKDFYRRSKLKFPKNFNTHISDASEFSEDKPTIVYSKVPKDELIKPDSFDKFKSQSQKNSATLSIDYHRNECEKSRIQPVSCLPLRITSEKKWPLEDKQKCMQNEKSCDPILSIHNENNPTKSIFRYANEELKKQNKKQSPVCLDTEINLLQKDDMTNTIVDTLNHHNNQKLSSECIKSFHYKINSGELKNETIILENSKDNSKTDCIRTQVIDKKKYAEKEAVTSSDLILKPTKESLSTAKFTNSIDAKSKWLEMKKKFYGNNFNTVIKNVEPEKLETQNLRQIKSVSKLPAQKIFQYNMQVGRARQMGGGLHSAEETLLNDKSSHLKYHESCTSKFMVEDKIDARKNASQYLQSTIQTTRHLSQTQSLSQWPNSSSNLKKYSSEQKPKPKPRTEGRFNHNRTKGECCKAPKVTAACANSSMSSSDFRAVSKKYSTDNNPSRSNPKSESFEHCSISRNEILKSAPVLDQRSQMPNIEDSNSMKDTYLSNDNDQIQSLILFCSYPSTASN